ncbi:MAG TPA: hypothetical protein VJW51_08340 [Candidatus Acidoferrales bacterium]|nr:hypothetical protein [Candidatus Acidoferrales bacterium]
MAACAGLAAWMVASAAIPGSRDLAAHPAPQAASEVVANLAAGRVAVLVAKDGIAVATVESQVEPGTVPPLIVPLSSLRVGVLLGPVEWIRPGMSRPPLHLAEELRRSAAGARTASSKEYATPATDIEGIGLGFLEPLRNAAAQLHGPLHLQPGELFTELMLVGYAPGYGPEVWSLRYRGEQEILRGDFYRTAIHRPEYVQLYPPDKGQPKTLMETRYPPDDPGEPAILDLLKANDSRVAALRGADPGLGRAAELLGRGESQKIMVYDGLELLRAAFQSLSPRDARQMIVTITEQKGIQWVVAQPELVPVIPVEKREGPPSAPTLFKKPPSP